MTTFRAGTYLIAILWLVFWTGARDFALAAPGELIITHARMSTSSIPLWVAARQNFFAKYGVKVESLVDTSIVKRLDDSGFFFEKLYAEYGVK